MRANRWKKLTALFAAGALLAAVAVAAPRANPRRGKVFYKNNCRVCHDGSTKAPELSPLTKTMKQWESAFEPNGKVTAHLNLVKEKTGVALTDQDLLDMQSYLVQHAADSDQPATCGN